MQLNHLPLRRTAGWAAVVGLASGFCGPACALDRQDPPAAATETSSDGTGPAARVEGLILQLGSTTYLERSEAERELLAIGFDAFDQLKAAETSQDAEIAARARHLTRQLTDDWTREEDPPAVRQLMQGYARMSIEQRYQLIGRLAALPEDDRFDPLCRIARFAESEVVAKRAALTLISTTASAEAEAALEQAKAIEDALGQSRRTSAAWLRTYAHQLRDPGGSIDAWQTHVDTELVELAAADTPLGRFVAIDLLQHVSELHEQMGNDEKLIALLLQMVKLDETGSADVLERLVHRLIRTKNWAAVERIVDRYEDRFRSNPLLLYMLAEARRAQGDVEKSNELAESAFKLSENSFMRRDVAGKLVKKGLYDWAEREYRDVLVKEPAISNEGVLAVSWLSAMLYDIQRHTDAAKLLEDYLAQWQEELAKNGDALGRVTLLNERELKDQIQQFKARADYNRACHAHLQDDPVTERKYLEQAIQHSPRDIDVLIAMYRLPDNDVDFRVDVLGRIEEEAARMDAALREEPNEATYYNNWAWLVANTHGDYDKAVRYAHRAVELANQESLPGFLDTLGRAYYAKGDLQNALKYQRRAAELDAHTQQLQRQLEEFEKAAAES